MLTRSVLIQEFQLCGITSDRYAEGIQYLAPLVKTGRSNSRKPVTEGFEKIPEALLGLFSGKNTRKMIVKVIKAKRRLNGLLFAFK